MEIQSVITQLKDKFGDQFDVTQITEKLKGMDLSNFSMSEIVDKFKGEGLLGDLDGDGVKESIFAEIKGKVGSLFG